MNIEIADACTAWTWVCALDDHPGLAAWVQALGIIGTLVAAQIPIWAARRQQRESRREHAAAAGIALATAEGFFRSLADEAQRCLDDKTRPFQVEISRDQLGHAREEFAALSAPLVSDGQCAAPLSRVKLVFASMDSLLLNPGAFGEEDRLKVIKGAADRYALLSERVGDFLILVANGRKQAFNTYMERFDD